MNPKTVDKLREQTPELKEFVAYLAGKARECNTLEGLKVFVTPEALAFHTSVRIEVRDRITEILAPLIAGNSQLDLPDPAEYVV